MKNLRMKFAAVNLLLILLLSVLAHGGDVVIFDDNIANGQIIGADVSTERSYEGTSSVNYTTETDSGYTVFKFDLTSSVTVGPNRFLQMRVNFDPNTTYPASKIRRIQIIPTGGSAVTFEPDNADYYVDRQPAEVLSDRILFDSEPNTWQLMTLDLSSTPGIPNESTQLRQVNVVFHDAVNCFVDDVRVVSRNEDIIIFDDDVVTGSVSYQGSISTDTAYAGNSSIKCEGLSSDYNTIRLDLSGSVEIGDRRLLKMYVNFLTDGTYNDTMIRWIKLHDGTGYIDYKPEADPQPLIYVDGVLNDGPDPSRIYFDDDPSTWQELILDLSSGPGYSSSSIRILDITFKDNIRAYIDEVMAVDDLCKYDLVGDINNDCEIDLEDLAELSFGWLIDCNADGLLPECW